MNQPATRIDTATLDPLETASVDELRATQVKRLKWSLQHAYDNVPFYRQSFDKAGVHPDDIQSLDDLAKLPFTTKADLRDNYPFGMLATPMSEIIRIHASSGTTGNPRWWATPRRILMCGPMWWRVRSALLVAAVMTRYMWPMATGCLPAGWVPITVPSGWAARSSPCRGPN